MDIEDEPAEPRKVFARLKWKDPHGPDMPPQSMNGEDGYDAADEGSGDDPMDLG